jgi:hypothetical protein
MWWRLREMKSEVRSSFPDSAAIFIPKNERVRKNEYKLSFPPRRESILSQKQI